MTRLTTLGVIEDTNLKDGRIRYNVRLPDGTHLVVSRRLIVPEPAPFEELPAGTRLLVEHNGSSVIGAVLRERAGSPRTFRPEPAHPPHQDVYKTHEVSADTGRGLLSSGTDVPPERPITCPEIAPIFGAGGPVHQLLGERYRPRSGQIEMAEQVRLALQGRRHAVIEAGTGIGKSFAYLVPLIWSDAKAVVSTSNKALMSQLWHKDLPALARIAPKPFSVALLKGRSNYLCALRLRELTLGRSLPGMATDAEVINAGLRRIPSGDVEEMNLPSALRQRCTVDRHACEGRKCREYADCFYERARALAQGADIVVTNHALLAYNSLQHENKILPVRPVLVIDEAHELESYAVEALSFRIDRRTLGGIIHHKLARDAVDDALRQQATEANDLFFRAMRRQQPSASDVRWALRGEIREGMALWAVLNRLHRKMQGWSVPRELEGKFETLTRHCEEVLSTVHMLAHPEPEDGIRLCELAEDGAQTHEAALFAQYQPLGVSAALQASLFEVWPRVIATSATLSVNDDLGWFLRRTGASATARQPIVRQIRSPFDYPAQVLVYSPRNHGLRPEYQGDAAKAYLEHLTGEVKRLVEASRGRAFVLCTSRVRAQQLHDRLSPALPYLCLCQAPGASRQVLVERFRTDGHAVLFGTRSFWEGVDIPGDALSLVILDKIPFLPVGDPLLERQKQQVAARGGDWFAELQLGQAILTLRQGAGRLVRAENDRGVIALLDARVHETAYGTRILSALPNGRHTDSFEEVRVFFSGTGGTK